MSRSPASHGDVTSPILTKPAHISDQVWGAIVSDATQMPPPNPNDLLQFTYSDGRPGVGDLLTSSASADSKKKQQQATEATKHTIHIGTEDHMCFKDQRGTVRLCIIDPSAVKSVDICWLGILLSHKAVSEEQALRVYLNLGYSLDGFHELHQLWHLPISCPDFPEFNRDGTSDP